MAKGHKRGKLKTARKKKFDINELNALSTAYGEPIGRKEYLMYVAVPALVAGAFVTILFYNVIVTIIAVVLGALYGLWHMLPNITARKYYLASLHERGRYITLLTQIATNKEKSMLRVLHEATERLNKDGELYKEMISLTSNIGTDITPENVQIQFRLLRDKYKVDPTFNQFLEQVETGLLNGNNNVDTLQEIEGYHTQMRKNMNNFIKIKDSHIGGYKTILGLVVFLTVVASYSIGINDFIEGFSRTWVGWSFGGVFLLANVFFFMQIMKFYFDDDVTSMGG